MAAGCLARCALQQGITPSWRRPLRSDGVPLVLGGCHMCQEGCPMMRHLLGHLHEHGITLGVPPNGWEAPHHCARDTSTNVVPPVGGRLGWTIICYQDSIIYYQVIIFVHHATSFSITTTFSNIHIPHFLTSDCILKNACKGAFATHSTRILYVAL